MSNIWGHFKTITTHKIVVMKECFKIGLYKQGIKHDLSKYSPIEFWAGVKYFQGDRSPIDKEKQVLGYSLGWLHHKGHNMHHWEYWMDKNKDGIIFYPAPKNVVKEMICDRVAACMIYQKDKYTNRSALEYFEKSTDKCQRRYLALCVKKIRGNMQRLCFVQSLLLCAIFFISLGLDEMGNIL